LYNQIYNLLNSGIYLFFKRGALKKRQKKFLNENIMAKISRMSQKKSQHHYHHKDFAAEKSKNLMFFVQNSKSQEKRNFFQEVFFCIWYERFFY